MKSNLDVKDWKSFALGYLFDIRKGKRLTKEDFIVGNTPFIAAIDSNNGCRDFIGQDPIFQGNTITVSYNGSVAEAFYQNKPFWASDDINVLYPKFDMNRKKALFIVTLIKYEKYRFNYGRKWHKERMEASIIKLPAKNNEPDWEFMEQFIDAHTHDYSYAAKPAQNLSTPELNVAEWEFYEIGDLFNVKYGNGFELVNLSENNKGVSFVARTEKNNGVSAFVDEFPDIEPFEANSITVAVGGSVLSTFLQPKPFYSGFHILVLEPKEKISNAAKLFLTTLICREKYRYNYGRQANRTLRTLKIKLPTRDSKPDWNFMTKFIHTLPFSSQIN